MGFKAGLKAAMRLCGYEMRKLPKQDMGRDPFYDIRKLSLNRTRPIVFDVGANLGQTIDHFRKTFEHPIIHSFEPGLESFKQLETTHAGLPDVRLVNSACGANTHVREFLENSYSNWSSFLTPSVDCIGEITRRREVDVVSLDEYCASQSIGQIEVLKIDTQGFDLEVIKGADELIKRKAIHLILIEITFSDIYEGIPPLDQIYRHLADRGFRLVTFYQFHFKHDRAHWADALFVHPEYKDML